MSYTNLIYHIVFSTKDRRECLTPERIARIWVKVRGDPASRHEKAPMALQVFVTWRSGIVGDLNIKAKLAFGKLYGDRTFQAVGDINDSPSLFLLGWFLLC